MQQLVFRCARHAREPRSVNRFWSGAPVGHLAYDTSSFVLSCCRGARKPSLAMLFTCVRTLYLK